MNIVENAIKELLLRTDYVLMLLPQAFLFRSSFVGLLRALPNPMLSFAD